MIRLLIGFGIGLAVGITAVLALLTYLARRQERRSLARLRERLALPPVAAAPADRAAFTVVAFWAERAGALGATELTDVGPLVWKMVGEVASVYGKPPTAFRFSQAAGELRDLLNEDLPWALKQLDQRTTLETYLRAYGYYKKAERTIDRVPEAVRRGAVSLFPWGRRLVQTLTGGPLYMVFGELASRGVAEATRMTLGAHVGDLVRRIGVAAMRLYSESAIDHFEREEMRRNLLFHGLLHAVRAAPDREAILVRYLREKGVEAERAVEAARQALGERALEPAELAGLLAPLRRDEFEELGRWTGPAGRELLEVLERQTLAAGGWAKALPRFEEQAGAAAAPARGRPDASALVAALCEGPSDPPYVSGLDGVRWDLPEAAVLKDLPHYRRVLEALRRTGRPEHEADRLLAALGVLLGEAPATAFPLAAPDRARFSAAVEKSLARDRGRSTLDKVLSVFGAGDDGYPFRIEAIESVGP